MRHASDSDCTFTHFLSRVVFHPFPARVCGLGPLVIPGSFLASFSHPLVCAALAPLSALCVFSHMSSRRIVAFWARFQQ